MYTGKNYHEQIKRKNLGLTLCYVNLFEYEIYFGEKCCVQIDTMSGTSVNINDANKNNNKLYWKLLKDVFHTKPTMDLQPLQYTTHTGESKYIFSDMGKINALNDYFSSIANVDEKRYKFTKLLFYVMKNLVIL